jgi:hypothetical protein
MNRTTLMISMASLIAACGSEPVAGGDGALSMRLALTASQPPQGSAPGAIALEDQGGTAFTIESAEAHVRHIRLDLPEGQACADLDFDFRAPVSCEDERIEIAGPFVVDLIAGTAQPSLANLRIPPGDYARVDVRFDDSEPDDGLVDASAALADHTMHATGRFDHDGQEMSFELLLKLNEDARFEAPGGIALGEAGGSDALLMLDVSDWFSALPVIECMEDGELTVEDGTLLIDDERSECSEIEDTLKDAIKGSGQLQGA